MENPDGLTVAQWDTLAKWGWTGPRNLLARHPGAERIEDTSPLAAALFRTRKEESDLDEAIVLARCILEAGGGHDLNSPFWENAGESAMVWYTNELMPWLPLLIEHGLDLQAKDHVSGLPLFLSTLQCACEDDDPDDTLFAEEALALWKAGAFHGMTEKQQQEAMALMEDPKNAQNLEALVWFVMRPKLEQAIPEATQPGPRLRL